MRRRHPRALSALLPAVALLAVSAGDSSAQDQPEAPALSRYRVAVMTSLQEHNSALRLLLSGDVAQPEHVVLHARAVHDMLAMAAVSFPAGSGGPGTRALPAIWENWDDFAAKLDAARASAAALQAAAEAGDVEGTAAALREVGQSCLSCHREYRARGVIGGGS
ncbi:MAG TPA: cytochrome c [Longimicrobiales bacterium]|nr:cytochrome c [Longimicrobiales bacterium]